MRPPANFRLTLPASAVHTLQNTKLSSQLRKRSSKYNKEPSCGFPSPCSYTWPTASISFKFGGTAWQPSFTARSKKQSLPRQLAPLSSIWAQLICAMILNYLGYWLKPISRWRNQRIDSPIIKAKQNVLDNFHFSHVRDWLYEGKISSEYNKLIYSYYREIVINVRKVV